MKKINLSGREIAVVRALDLTLGTLGIEIYERTHIEVEELVGTINGLMDVGFLECEPYRESLTVECLPKVVILANPGYVHDLKSAIIRSL